MQGSAAPEISVIIPAHNEQETVADVIEKVGKALSGRDFEILVIDDGSADGTAERAERAGARVVSHPYPKGNGAAIKRGIREARGRRLVMLDADGQHPPESIPELLQHAERYDMVVASRTPASRQRLHRRVANWFFSRVASYIAAEPVADLTSGFRTLPRELALRYVDLLPNGFSYPSTLTVVLARAGYTILHHPVTCNPAPRPSNIRPLRDGLRFLLILLRVGVGFAPARIFLPLAGFLFLLGCGWYGYTYAVSRRFTNMSLLLFCTAVIIFMLGLVAEQIAALRRQRRED